MAMVEKSKQQYDPSDSLAVVGTFRCICTGIKQGVVNKTYPDGKPLIVVEFTVHGESPSHRGKKVAIVCGESLYRDARTGRESRFLVHSREMGVCQPEAGYDPCTLLDRQYTVTSIMRDGKCYVDTAIPYIAPAGSTAGAKKAKPASVQSAPVKDETVPF